MTDRGLIATVLFTAICAGGLFGIIRYADALEATRPHVLTITYTYSEADPPTLDNCQSRASFWSHNLPSAPEGWARGITCLPWSK